MGPKFPAAYFGFMLHLDNICLYKFCSKIQNEVKFDFFSKAGELSAH